MAPDGGIVMGRTKPRVLLVDDHRLFTGVMRMALEELGMEVLVAVSTAADGIEAARRERPDLVLLDLGLPDEDGIVAGRALLDELPDMKIIAVTAQADQRRAKEAIRAGFRAFVMKSITMSEFESSIAAVLDGHVVVPGRFGRATAGEQSAEERQGELLLSQLTPREQEILELLADGMSSTAIARGLNISPNTVRTHIQSLMSKLQVHSRLEAAAFAVRHGVLDATPRRTTA
jgi:two-component system, NarL family, nitrate/nitrite response regulator NarL